MGPGAEAAHDRAVHRPDEPVVARRRVAVAHAGADLRLQRVVLRLELGLAGADALEDLLLLLFGRRHLLPFAVGLGAELGDLIALASRPGFGVPRLRLLSLEVVLGVGELVLELALPLELA